MFFDLLIYSLALPLMLFMLGFRDLRWCMLVGDLVKRWCVVGNGMFSAYESDKVQMFD